MLETTAGIVGPVLGAAGIVVVNDVIGIDAGAVGVAAGAGIGGAAGIVASRPTDIAEIAAEEAAAVGAGGAGCGDGDEGVGILPVETRSGPFAVGADGAIGLPLDCAPPLLLAEIRTLPHVWARPFPAHPSHVSSKP